MVTHFQFMRANNILCIKSKNTIIKVQLGTWGRKPGGCLAKAIEYSAVRLDEISVALQLTGRFNLAGPIADKALSEDKHCIKGKKG